MFILLLGLLLHAILLACDSNSQGTDLVDDHKVASKVDSVNYNAGILLFNADQGTKFWTEFNTQIRPHFEHTGGVRLYRNVDNANPFMEIRASDSKGEYGFKMSTFKTLFDDYVLPNRIRERVDGVRFNAIGLGEDSMRVLVYDFRGNLQHAESFMLETNTWKTYELDVNATAMKSVYFVADSDGDVINDRFGVDDVYLRTKDREVFYPPSADNAFLSWLKESSYNFFEWNYRPLNGDKAVVLESYNDDDKVSLSGIGYAYAIYVIAEKDGFISSELAKHRISSMVEWQYDQNWFDGTGGWHGFPHHYFRKDGSYYWADVSTIDWAICAAGLRVVKQHYIDDYALTSKIDALLNRARWDQAIDSNNKIVMGFNGETGIRNTYRWALAYSEETELVYLEAVASGYLSEDVFSAIVREEKKGFYPSWFGAGFTYNWLQLWTGSIEPYKSNSVMAYTVDATTSLNAFNRPLMGLTASQTVKDVDSNGFLNWSSYISNQGGNVHAALNGVVQWSAAAYGAALALPFNYDAAMTGLREMVEMGYYHEYLGLPDNIRMNDMPENYVPAPYWNTYDINIGPLIMSIEQLQENRIAELYLRDAKVSEALELLIESF